jgi:hypothetical protein
MTGDGASREGMSAAKISAADEASSCPNGPGWERERDRARAALRKDGAAL